MKISRKLILFCLLLGTLLLTGCGIEVNTNMTINKDFEGTKTISCFVSKQDMALHFKGDSEKIKTMLENHCPACFDYTINETKSGTEYVFSLSFSSLDDYKAALTTVLNFSPEISYKGIDSIFSKSIDLNENFSSIDLLRWFEILLTDEYEIQESQLEHMWDIKNTTLTWQKKTYSSSSDSIQISSHTLSAFDGISIYTEETDDRNFIRKIQFAIPKETLDKRVLELEQIFEDLKPKSTTGIWTTTATGRIYEMTFTDETFEKLSQKTNAILGTNSESPGTTAAIDSQHLLKLNLEYWETLDFSNFLCTSDGQVPVSYYFKPNGITELDSERIQREINNAFIPKLYENGYYRIFSGNCSDIKIRTLASMHLPVLKCDINTILEKDDSIKREILFTLDNLLYPTEYELFSSYIKSNSNDVLSMKAEEKGNHLILSMTQSGTDEDINTSSEIIFGSEKFNLKRIQPSFIDIISKETPTELIEQIHLSSFIREGSDDFTLFYTFTNQSHGQIKTAFITNENQETVSVNVESDNSVSYETKDSSITVNIIRSAHSKIGISILILLFLMILLGILFFIKKNPMKTKHQEENPIISDL